MSQTIQTGNLYRSTTAKTKRIVRVTRIDRAPSEPRIHWERVSGPGNLTGMAYENNWLDRYTLERAADEKPAKRRGKNRRITGPVVPGQFYEAISDPHPIVEVTGVYPRTNTVHYRKVLGDQSIVIRDYADFVSKFRNPRIEN